MLVLLGVIFLIIAMAVLNKDEDLFVIAVFVVMMCIILSAICGGVIIHGRTIQSKIDMYTEQNEEIEQDVNVLVENYMKYESDTYGLLKGESSISLVSLYPELKSDSLVEEQISLYMENNRDIKRLKEKKINISTWKWWLYFGK